MNEFFGCNNECLVTRSSSHPVFILLSVNVNDLFRLKYNPHVVVAFDAVNFSHFLFLVFPIKSKVYQCNNVFKFMTLPAVMSLETL